MGTDSIELVPYTQKVATPLPDHRKLAYLRDFFILHLHSVYTSKRGFSSDPQDERFSSMTPRPWTDERSGKASYPSDTSLQGSEPSHAGTVAMPICPIQCMFEICGRTVLLVWYHRLSMCVG